MLAYADLKKPFIVETDASFKGLGAVLMKKDEDDLARVISYTSRSLRPGEKSMKNYSSAKLELLALKWAVTEKFRDYLLGSKFTVITDNNPLAYINKSKLGITQIRWMSDLALLDFDIKYRSSSENRVADALSHRQGILMKMMLRKNMSYFHMRLLVKCRVITQKVLNFFMT